MGNNFKCEKYWEGEIFKSWKLFTVHYCSALKWCKHYVSIKYLFSKVKFSDNPVCWNLLYS